MMKRPPSRKSFSQATIMTAMARLGALACLLAACTSWNWAAADAAAFATLSGARPLVVADGGTSGMYPDMTMAAYQLAAKNGATYITCGVVMTEDNQAVCRPALDLGNSTNVAQRGPFAARKKTYTVGGISMTGYFSSDFTLAEIRTLYANQPLPPARRPLAFNNYYRVVTPSEAIEFALPRGIGIYLDLLSPSFFESRGLNSTTFAVSLLRAKSLTHSADPAFVTSSELAALAAMRAATAVKLVFKLLGANVTDTTYTEPQTKQHYGYFTAPAQLAALRPAVDGVLVPKTFVNPQGPGPVRDGRFFAGNASGLVANAHKAGLAVHVYGVANDAPGLPWYWRTDPYEELLSFFSPGKVLLPGGGAAAADAVLTPFPATAEDALECYATAAATPVAAPAPAGGLPTDRPLILGDANSTLPGQTAESFKLAIEEGVDVIVCMLQLTSDFVPICRESPDLTMSTDVLLKDPSATFTNQFAIQPENGVFCFNYTSDFILNNLRATQNDSTLNQEYNGQFKIITLEQFLQIPHQYNHTVGAIIDFQFPTFYNFSGLHVSNIVLDVVDSFNATLPPSRFNTTFFQSFESLPLTRIHKLRPKLHLIQRIEASLDFSSGVDQYYYTSHIGIEFIRSYSKIVNVHREVVLPPDGHNKNRSVSFFLTTPTDFVQQCHDNGFKVFGFPFRNDASKLEWDYLGDPHAQLNYWTKGLKFDGVTTSQPATARRFFTNPCYTAASNKAAYNVTPVVPGEYLALARTAQGEVAPSLSPYPPPGFTLTPYFAPTVPPTAAPTPLPTAGAALPPPPSPLSPANAPPASPPPPSGSAPPPPTPLPPAPPPVSSPATPPGGGPTSASAPTPKSAPARRGTAYGCPLLHTLCLAAAACLLLFRQLGQ